MDNTLITKPLTKILAQFGFPSNKPDFRSLKCQNEYIHYST